MTMAALLPPSSACSGVPRRAQSSAASLPARCDPVRVTAAMPGWVISACAVPASPKTVDSSAGGIPAAATLATIARATSGAGRAGFQTTLLPKTSAEAIFARGSATGLFHGVITATTPRAQCRVSNPSPWLSSRLSTSCAATRTCAIARSISSRASVIGLPSCRATIPAHASRLCSTTCAQASSSDARSAAGAADHARPATCAPATALSINDESASGTRARIRSEEQGSKWFQSGSSGAFIHFPAACPAGMSSSQPAFAAGCARPTAASIASFARKRAARCSSHWREISAWCGSGDAMQSAATMIA